MQAARPGLAVRLYVHVHAPSTDGGFEPQPDGGVVFRPVTVLAEADLVRVLDEVAADLAAAGVLEGEPDVDATLAACVQLSLSTPPSASASVPESGLVADAAA